MIPITAVSINLITMLCVMAIIGMAKLNWKNIKLTFDNADESAAGGVDVLTLVAVFNVPSGEMWKIVQGDDLLCDFQSVTPTQIVDGTFVLNAMSQDKLNKKPYSHHDNSLTPTWAQQKSVEYRPHKIAKTFAILGAVGNKIGLQIELGTAMVVANSHLSINCYKAVVDPTTQVRKYKRWILD